MCKCTLTFAITITLNVLSSYSELTKVSEISFQQPPPPPSAPTRRPRGTFF